MVETPAVAIDAAGDAAVVWRQGVGGNHVVLASSRPAGGSWAPPFAISSSALNAEAPDVAMSPSGNEIAVWQSSSGATSVVESNDLPLGGSWTGEEAISAPATVTEPPHVVADPATGDFTAIWSRSGTGLVAEVASRPAGGGWQAPKQISTPALEAHAPVVAVDSAGDAVAAWYRFDGSVGSVEAVDLAAGGPWASSVRISPVGAEAEAPQVAMSPAGAAQVVWSGWNESTHNYVTRTSSLLPSGTWQVSKPISLEGEESYGPHVALDQSGHSVIVWNGEVSLGAEIKSSFREITTPLLVTRAGSGSGTVTSMPAGIDCGATCTAAFPEESTVSLTPKAAAGSSFAGWSGACSGTGACTVTIGEAQSSVGAEFVSTAPGDGTGGGVIPAPAPPPISAPVSPPAPAPVPAPAPSNTFAASSTSKGSVIKLSVSVPGPGTIDVLATHVNVASWATASSAAFQPGSGRLAWGRVTVVVKAAGTVAVTLHPNALGKRLIARERRSGRALSLRVWVSFAPVAGTPRSRYLMVSLLKARRR